MSPRHVACGSAVSGGPLHHPPDATAASSAGPLAERVGQARRARLRAYLVDERHEAAVVRGAERAVGAQGRGERVQACARPRGDHDGRGAAEQLPDDPLAHLAGAAGDEDPRSTRRLYVSTTECHAC
jgi:hypothetical protein